MASADMRKELECSVCLNNYTDPVMLVCGHNFCRECIIRVLDAQDASGGYSCPECREEFRERPALHRNITLRNILDTFRLTQPDEKESGIFCTYCIHATIPAVKFCLHCEASLCDNHLRVHNKSPEHVIASPSTSPENRRCSLHRKFLEYYCKEDSACVCVYCLVGEHRGHQTESLDEASEAKKSQLRNVLQKLTTKRDETETRVQSLREHQRKLQEKAAAGTEKVNALFRDLRTQLDDQKRRVLKDISGWAQQASSSISDLILQLESRKDEMSKKMGHFEELCKSNDPMTVLQESDMGDTEDGDDEDTRRCDMTLLGGGNLDLAWISHMSNTLSDTIKGMNICLYVQEAEEILLDANTANNSLQISDDKKTASMPPICQKRPETPDRFQFFPQVFSTQGFSSGQHYWEVDVGGSDSWRVGMCYPSMDRKGNQSCIGSNKLSWGLYWHHCRYTVIHDSKKTQLPDVVSSDRVRIYLDYEAGQISFYSLSNTMRHLHTFTATFTESLYASLALWHGVLRVCGGSSS